MPAWLHSLSAVLLLLAAASPGSSTPTDPNSPQITILYDAFGPASAMRKDWGYSAFIQFGGKRILFDTGNSPDNLEQNAKAKEIDLSKLDFVAMSHRHGDHMGGLPHVLRVNPQVKIYAPKEGFGVYGSDLPGAFYRKEPSLPADERYFGGTVPDVMRFGSACPGANFQLVDKTTEIAPNMRLIALVLTNQGRLNFASSLSH